MTNINNMIISRMLILKKIYIVQRLWGYGRRHLARFLSTSSPSSEAWAGGGSHALQGAKGEGGLGFKGFSAAQKMRTRNDSQKKKKQSACKRECSRLLVICCLG
jgi:hypothetical protein